MFYALCLYFSTINIFLNGSYLYLIKLRERILHLITVISYHILNLNTTIQFLVFYYIYIDLWFMFSVTCSNDEDIIIFIVNI